MMAQAGAADPGSEGRALIDATLPPDVMRYMPGIGAGVDVVHRAADSGLYDSAMYSVPAQALGGLLGDAGRYLERKTRGGPFDVTSKGRMLDPLSAPPPPEVEPLDDAPASQPGAIAAPEQDEPAPGLSTPAARRGGPSAKVAALQEKMKASGFDPGPIDGIWGPKTQAAYAAMKSTAPKDPMMRRAPGAPGAGLPSWAEGRGLGFDIPM